MCLTPAVKHRRISVAAHAGTAHFVNTVAGLGKVNRSRGDVRATSCLEHRDSVFARLLQHLVFVIAVFHIKERDGVAPFVALARMQRHAVLRIRKLLAKGADSNSPSAR